MSLSVTVEFRVLYCGECGIPFAMLSDHIGDALDDERDVYCPNGHAREYQRIEPAAEADSARVKELRQQLAQAMHRAEQSEARAAELAGPDARAVKVDATATATAETTTPRASRPTLKCPDCGKPYKLASCLRGHLRREHNRDAGTIADAMLAAGFNGDA